MPRPPAFLPAPVGYAGTGAKARRGLIKNCFRVVKIETAVPPFGRLAATTGQYFVSDACPFEAEALAMQIRTLPKGVTIHQIISDIAIGCDIIFLMRSGNPGRTARRSPF